MKRERLLFFAASMCAVLLVCASSAFAAEEGGSAGAGKATEIFKWINFAILAGAVVWLCVKKAPGFFRGRADEISSAITKATSAKAEADRVLREAEAKLARLEQEVAELRAQAQKEAAAETERIRALAKVDAEKIGVAGKTEIEAAERAARVELKRIAARLAVDGAESLLAKQLTPKAQEALISDFVKNLQERPN
jgi:F-type H+-transporting ATPase subunit b